MRSLAGVARVLMFLMFVVSFVGTAAADAVIPVESKKVCMVNNTVFQRDQIPVEVAGKTYYGCCEMCKSRLEQSAEARQAIDPVSGRTVDKSQAVIGATKDGAVLYFENEANLRKFGGS